MRKVLYTLTVLALVSMGVYAQQAGGAFVPGFDYDIAGAWNFSGTKPTLTGGGSVVGTTATQTLTNKTLTSPTITGATLTTATITSPTGLIAYEDVTATNIIAASESGTTYYLNSATEFVSTLPAPAAGLKFTFIVKAAPSGASYTIVTASSSNIIKGLQNSVAGDAGDNGTADDTISFVDGQAVAGDKVEVYSDGTSWFAYAVSKVAAGVTFTQAS